jgi:hypothetical protein
MCIRDSSGEPCAGTGGGLYSCDATNLTSWVTYSNLTLGSTMTAYFYYEGTYFYDVSFQPTLATDDAYAFYELNGVYNPGYYQVDWYVDGAYYVSGSLTLSC